MVHNIPSHSITGQLLSMSNNPFEEMEKAQENFWGLLGGVAATKQKEVSEEITNLANQSWTITKTELSKNTKQESEINEINSLNKKNER